MEEEEEDTCRNEDEDEDEAASGRASLDLPDNFVDDYQESEVDSEAPDPGSDLVNLSVGVCRHLPSLWNDLAQMS